MRLKEKQKSILAKFQRYYFPRLEHRRSRLFCDRFCGNSGGAKKSCVLFLSVILSACSGDNSDLVKYINDVKSQPGAPIERFPEFSPIPSFKFPENDSRRSPFKPTEHKKTEDFAPDEHREKQPLEAYPLDALKFVGILKQENQLWALIQDPSKKVVPVKVGNYMGLNYGRILSINTDEIKLEERIKKVGTWEKQITIIHLNTSK